MKSIALIALALVAVTAAFSADEKKVVQIVRSSFDQNPDGSYSFEFENSDGSKRIESGLIKEVRDEENNLHKVVVVKGQYFYITQDGQPESINYEADENGYRADGPSVPKVPVARR